MNRYPKWWNTTVTIYNKYTDPQTKVVLWYKNVISDTFWKDVGNKITVGNTVLETNDIICRIRKDDRYKPYHEWVKTPNDKMADFFTLNPEDIIIKGEVDDTIDEYVAGYRSNDIINKYKKLQGCMKIEKVGDNTGGGRGNEHYLVRGV